MEMFNMGKNVLFLVMLLMAMPLAIADTTLFDGTISSGQSNVFYDSANIQNTVLVQDVDNNMCLISIGGVSTWVSDGDEVEIAGFDVEVEDTDPTKCELKIKPKETPKVNARITALKVLNVEPNSEGFYFVEDGTEVKFLAEITSDAHMDDLEWKFFNNGYPNGVGATDDINGDIDIGVGENELEFSMIFREDMDKIYHTGSFITVLIIDPNGRQTTTPAGMNYYGISIYTEGDDGCYRYRDPAGHLIDAGVCEISEKEKDRAVTKVVCLSKEEKFDTGNKEYDVVLTNRLGVLRVNGETVAGNPYYADDFFMETKEYSSEPYCFEIVLGCRGKYCEDTDYGSNGGAVEITSGRYYSLEEGESRNHVVDGITHTVELLIVEDVSPASATFKIDGEVTWQMIEGDIFSRKEDDFRLSLSKITLNNAFDDENLENIVGMTDVVSYQIMNEDYDNSVKTGVRKISEKLVERGPSEEGEFLMSNCDDGRGCYVNHDMNKCLPFGTRLEYEGVASYCDIDGDVKSQKEDNLEANNNYECRSNSARYGVCENIEEQQSAMKAIFGWLSRLFGGN